ncbi:dethiobiotin synthase [Tsukamurella soli]|uniref:ATP-dependent dethiobiotin synthetase BioD n=1 Tax=Tsukamurella soli TaxID=644556 RepID=A0ABP8KEG8_9ACTN
MTVVAVTGTSTGVGKTVTAAAIAAAARAAGGDVVVVKPAQTGFGPDDAVDGDGAEPDTAVVGRLAQVTAIEHVRFPDPLAPLTAARRAGLCPLLRGAAGDLVRRHDRPGRLTLVEGAGGVLVRLGTDRDGTPFTLIDLAGDLAASVVVVAEPALGTLNHTELTTRALAAAGVRCAGIVLSRWPERPGLAERCNLTELPELTGVPVVGRVPDGAAHLRPEDFARAAQGWFEPGWIAGLGAADIART